MTECNTDTPAERILSHEDAVSTLYCCALVFALVKSLNILGSYNWKHIIISDRTNLCW